MIIKSHTNERSNLNQQAVAVNNPLTWWTDVAGVAEVQGMVFTMTKQFQHTAVPI